MSQARSLNLTPRIRSRLKVFNGMDPEAIMCGMLQAHTQVPVHAVALKDFFELLQREMPETFAMGSVEAHIEMLKHDVLRPRQNGWLDIDEDQLKRHCRAIERSICWDLQPTNPRNWLLASLYTLYRQQYD
ncbi:hypothetical protein GF380_03205 [Candidatus Uhrbacteria bacterium]|nr:hypothetical protein [Candidatus Uhrbacteria bacterium]MBD3284150.1 hypothetical protein [Candidatus Uhrbacteria bacterium]